MKTIFSKATELGAAAAAFIMTAFIFGKTKSNGVNAVLACNKGEGFIDTAVKILISVVIGALVLAGLYLLFNSTILPTLTTRIQEMFNYNG